MSAHRVVDPARARHPFEASIIDEHCVLCGALATHIVAESMGTSAASMESYLCCAHFSWIIDDCSMYLYDFPIQRADR